MTKYYAPALDKGLDILEYLSEQSVPQSQQEIATGIQKTPNEIYRMLIILEKRGFINKDPLSGKYSLTLRLFQLAHHHSPVDRIVKAAEVHMQNLTHAINQSVHLSILHHNKLMIIDQTRSLTPVSLSVEVGSLFPLEETISGKLILASLNREKRHETLNICDSYPKMSSKSKELLHKELNELRGAKCKVSKSLLTEGVTDFAAPIYDMQNEVIAVLAVSTLTSQMRKLVSKETIEKNLLETVFLIREKLGLS